MPDQLTAKSQATPLEAAKRAKAKPMTQRGAKLAAATAAGAGATKPPPLPTGKGPPDSGAPPANVAQPPAADQQPEEREEPDGSGLWFRRLLLATPSWLVSLVFHMLMILLLAIWVLPAEPKYQFRQLVVAPGENEDFNDLERLEDPGQDVDVAVFTDVVAGVDSPLPQDVPVSPAQDLEAAAVQVELSDFGLERAPRNSLLTTVGAYAGSALSGRGSGVKGSLVAGAGGSEGSEKAVALGLKWLHLHQLPDGGWSFDHTRAPSCRGQCHNPGHLAEARIGATAMALLPFLGAGQTHKAGKYEATVKNGLQFLVKQMNYTPNGGALNERGGRMYSHGLAAIVLSEAFAMTHDLKLQQPAQDAINFICYAQDPAGGGWRYEPRQPGDTSVVGWQIMALKSGYMAYLRVPPLTVKKASDFLDSVQANYGANYGYTGPGSGEATTAIGLLCRMYLGWRKDNPALQRGIQWLSDRGPSYGNMYYNYYATQVMRHWEGEEWKKWNSVMRDQLVNSQAHAGHEEGSWYMSGSDHGTAKGGRLYYTAMATMILEVYYRHLPIYRTQSVEDNFSE